jgi:hypothetical protein
MANKKTQDNVINLNIHKKNLIENRLKKNRA